MGRGRAGRGGVVMEVGKKKSKATHRHRLGGREIRDKRKSKIEKRMGEEWKITYVYRDVDEKEHQRGFMWN